MPIREHIFKAKRIDNGEWVEGYYAKQCNQMEMIANYLDPETHAKYIKHLILVETIDYKYPFLCFEVDPETVCEYTGLADKNEKKIFEGDICRDGFGNLFVVEWDNENARFIGFTVENERRIVYVGREPRVEVIDNIYDNPELLEAET